MHDLRIALMQAGLEWENKEANLITFTKMFGRMNSQPDLVLLPEMFNTAFSMKPDTLAETMDGPGVEWMTGKAAEYQCVVAGTLMIRVKDAFVNRLIWVFPDGDLGFYDKRHLFRPGGEAEYFISGKERRCFTVKGWRVLPLTCFDLRFPVWSMNQYNDEAYDFDLLCYLANWPASRTYHWNSLLVARAIENQAYVAAVNRTGTDGNGISHSGNSMVISPFGEVSADAGDSSEFIIEYDLNYEQMLHYRKKFFIAPEWDLDVIRFQI